MINKNEKCDTIESISANTLEEIGDAAFKAIVDLLKEKGYSFVGGVSGGNEYRMDFKRDTMDILGYEKPILLKIMLPYAPEEPIYRGNTFKYSTIPDRENNTSIEDYFTLSDGGVHD